jgi:Lar family restriction alleviation protein
MEELKPCPFCGGEAKSIKGYYLGSKKTKWHKIYCIRCQNRTWEHPIKRDAIAAWNKRDY